jgi:hypothetical protein
MYARVPLCFEDEVSTEMRKAAAISNQTKNMTASSNGSVLKKVC